MLAQFVQNPAKIYWEAIKHVMVYLGTTKGLWLTFGGKLSTSPLAKGFCDVDWASQPHRHSISGYSFHIGQGAVTWSSKKQYIIMLSSTELEYIALAHASKEGIWLRAFLSEIQDSQEGTMGIKCDNQSAIALSKDNKFHQRTKHIDIHYHYIREAVEDRKIQPLSKTKFQGFVTGLGLKPWREEEKNNISS